MKQRVRRMINVSQSNLATYKAALQYCRSNRVNFSQLLFLALEKFLGLSVE